MLRGGDGGGGGGPIPNDHNKIAPCGMIKVFFKMNATLTIRLISALRWATTRATLMFHSLWGTITRECPQTTTFEERGDRSEESNLVASVLSSLTPYRKARRAGTPNPSVMVKCCLMSSDVSWHIRDKLWPMPKHGSINLYVHGNQKAR